MLPALQDFGDRQRRAEMREQFHALADRLQHSEFDAVVDELDEMARARRPGMDIAALDRELAQERLDHGDRFGLAADHEAGALARAGRAAGGTGVDEMNALLLEPDVPADGIAPVRSPAVANYVAAFECTAQLIEGFISQGTSRQIEKHEARRGQRLSQAARNQAREKAWRHRD